MSEQEMKNIIKSFDNTNYVSYRFSQYVKSEYAEIWTKDKILTELQRAFSLGFHGIHFVPSKYESCISEILEYYFETKDHYIFGRICETHKMICIYPNYKKLKVAPNSCVKESYKTDYILFDHPKESMADCCYDELL